MARRIWKDPKTNAGREALRKSVWRNLSALFKSGDKYLEIAQRWLANKTPEQRKVINELLRTRKLDKQFIAKRERRANEIDILYEQLSVKGKSVTKGLSEAFELPADPMRELNRIRFGMNNVVELFEKIRFKKHKHAEQFIPKEREEYFEDLPDPTKHNMATLKGAAVELNRIISIYGGKHIGSTEWEKIVAHLNLTIMRLNEGMPSYFTK